MPQWLKVAKLDEIPYQTGLEVVAGNRIVALFRSDDGIVALDGVCPHAGGPLAKGRVDGQIVTCPWHGWQFNVTTGRHCLSPSLSHPKIEVRVENDDVFVEIADA